MKRQALFFVIIISISGFSVAQENQPVVVEFPMTLDKNSIPKTYQTHVSKKPGHYTRDDWAAAIDSAWGMGLPPDEKLQIFETFWDNIDWYFACFQDLQVNWDSLKGLYEAELTDPLHPVSRGRFAAIMNYLSLALKEAHTNAEDKLVCWYTGLDPGVPLLNVGAWGNNQHFGAGLTPLADSSLLVYKTVSNHPIGLEPGDLVLGYDGILWHDLYEELLNAQLPVTGNWWGCSASAHWHAWMMSAGMNWHLYDTIDIVKYSTGDTLHLPTSSLINQNNSLYCTEQMDIPGVPKPNYPGKAISYGIIDGTQIGYIYGWEWNATSDQDFLEAVSWVMDTNTSGLIVDFRLNYGGNMFKSNPGLSLLFDTTLLTVQPAKRSDPDDHLAMTPSSPPENYAIIGNPENFYDKPIAVLVGPGALSSGDQVALRMKFHPMARFFGKSTTAAFNGPTVLDLGNSEWYCRYARSDFFLVSNPGHYLTHDEFEVDENVWHTPEMAAIGKDAVVEAAVDWIDLWVGVKHPVIASVGLNIYPNPASKHTTITFALSESCKVTLKLYDLMGRHIETIICGRLEKGEQSCILNAGRLQNGIYLLQLEGGRQRATVKVAVAR